MEHQKIWDKVLNPNEQVKYEFSIGARYKKVNLGILIVLGALTCFASIGLGAFIILVALFYCGFYLKAANAYAFTDRRVLIHTG